MDNIALIDRVRNGDKSACEEIIRANSALVWSIASKFKNRGCDPEDIFQIGCIGMIKAVNRFDPSYNVRFSTYAVPLIMGEIQRFLRDDGMIKVSRSLKELASKALALRESILCETGFEPTVGELAKQLNTDTESVVMALDAARPCDCLDRKLSDDSDGYLIDTVTYDLDTGESLVDSIAVRMAMEGLSDEDRKLIELRYFKGKTQKETADVFHISQVQISRREKRILEILKKKMTA